MKFSTISLLLALGATDAFAPQPSSTQHSTRLNLFGGGGDKGAKKGPGGGMMDQLAMFKKAQEVAKKKQTLDQELAKEEYVGTAVDGKVKATFKFIPGAGMMDPNPSYEATGFDFDDDWFEASSPEEISAAVKESIDDGIAITNKSVEEKYKVLQESLAGMMGPGGAPAPGAESA